MGAVRLSCSFSPFSSDHFRHSSVSPRGIIITGVWGAVLCSAILTLPGIFSVAARPCSHVELWKKCLLPEVGSVAAPVAFHVLFTVQGEPCSSPGELSHGQGGFGFQQCPAGCMAATGSEAVPVQGRPTLLQLYPRLKCNCWKYLHKIKKPQIMSLACAFWMAAFGTCWKVWPSLSWLFFPGLGLPPILSAWVWCLWCSCPEPHQRHDMV